MFNFIVYLCMAVLVVTCTAKDVCNSFNFEYCKIRVDKEKK